MRVRTARTIRGSPAKRSRARGAAGPAALPAVRASVWRLSKWVAVTGLGTLPSETPRRRRRACRTRLLPRTFQLPQRRRLGPPRPSPGRLQPHGRTSGTVQRRRRDLRDSGATVLVRRRPWGPPERRSARPGARPGAPRPSFTRGPSETQCPRRLRGRPYSRLSSPVLLSQASLCPTIPLTDGEPPGGKAVGTVPAEGSHAEGSGEGIRLARWGRREPRGSTGPEPPPHRTLIPDSQFCHCLSKGHTLF